ncbi:hypothetical protein H8356DRAFT_1326315 [Neocallimastix lanati (nom. inval.)]|nr:hypothetical protein H8356DRAFT_1326315 [Neocallimastix sp. JGI-2020a]
MNNKITLLVCLLLFLVNNIHDTIMNKKYILIINVKSFDDGNYPKYICANDNEDIIELPEGNTTKKYIVDIVNQISPVTMCTDKDYASRKGGDDKLCINPHL